MKNFIHAVLIGTCLLLIQQAAQAQQETPRPDGGVAIPVTSQTPWTPLVPARPEPNTRLEELLANVQAQSGQRFLVHPMVPEQVYLGGISVNEVDYEQLMSILRNHDLVTMEVAGRINILAPASVRVQALRVIGPDAQNVPDDEPVTMVLTVNNVNAAMLVPILRPLLPQWAHLSAMPEPGALIIVDRYANVRRIADIVAELDR